MTDADTLTVDLQDRVDELNTDIATVRSELQSVEEEAEDVAGDMAATDDLEEFEELEEEYNRLVAEYDELEAYEQRLETRRDLFRAKTDEWGGSTFCVKSLTWGDRNRIDDKVRAAAVTEGDEDTRAHLGKYMEAFVDVATVSTPPDAPAQAGAYPPEVGEWLYQKADAFNGAGGDGESDTGNSSLRQQVTPPESPPSSSSEDST